MRVSRTVIISFLTASAPMGALGATSSAFSYDPSSELGPAYWGDLKIDGNQCTGSLNSPIAVKSGSCDRYEDYMFTSGTCTTKDLKYELTTTGVKASFPDSCEKPTVQIPGIPGTYQALQFHIHTSSEHTIDGEFYGAELHTVHAEVDGDRYAVVGMMIQPDAPEEHGIFGQLLDGWQEVYDYNDEQCEAVGMGRRSAGRKLQHDRRTAEEAFNTYMLIPDGSAYYHYDGGLTTPPCSEVVWWNLADKPVSITPSQYSQLVDQIINFIHPAECKSGTYAGPVGSTSRPTQPLNGRTVERICATSASSTATLSFAAVGATLLAGATLFF